MTIDQQKRRRQLKKAAVKEFGETLTAAQELLGKAANETGEQASNIRSRVSAMLDVARSKLADLQDDAVDHAKFAARAADEYVHTNSWQVIGVAAAVGFLAGVWVSRR